MDDRRHKGEESRALGGDLKKLAGRLAQLEEALALAAQTAKARAKEVEALSAQVEKKKEAIALLENKVRVLLNSHSFRLGRSVLLPLRTGKRALLKLKGMWQSNFMPRVARNLNDPVRVHERKISVVEQIPLDFGRHRSGLKYGLQHLLRLHHPRGVLLDAFIERTFCWQLQKNFVYEKPWIGFIHVPPRMPEWFYPQMSNAAIFKSEQWQKSLPWCRGLFTFSAYHQRYLQGQLPVPVEVLRLPSEVPQLTWSWEAFAANPCKKVVQIGWWLRKLHAIFLLPQSPFKKIFLHVGHPNLEELMEKEKEILIKTGAFRQEGLDSVATVPFLAAEQYDQLLSKNIAFMELYDSSACNAIVECMVRHTPLLINPLEAVVEYLGEGYPFYFHSLAEAAAKLMDHDLIRETHLYLCRHSRQLELDGDHFLKAFTESEIYRALAPSPGK